MVAELETQRRNGFAAVPAAADEERRFLNGVFFNALALRAFIGLLIIFLELKIFNGDNVYYEQLGWDSAQKWNAIIAGRGAEMAAQSRLNTGMEIWVGAIYFVVGARLPIIPLAINWTLGAWNAVLVYHIARDLFSVSVARRACKFVAYLPSFAFWAALLYKDAIVLFFICVGLLAVARLQRGIRARYVLAAIVSLIALQFLRAYVGYLMGVAMLTGLLVGAERTRGLTRAQKIGLVTFIVVGTIAAGGLQRAQRHFSGNVLQQIVLSRLDLAQSAASGYLPTENISTLTAAAAYAPKGLAFLLLTPAPWQFGNLRQTLAIPETLLWWALIPATGSGMWWAWRHRKQQSLAVFVFTFSLALFYSLLIANIGTAVRERTQIIAFWLIFAAAGIELKRRGRLADLPPI